jgi:tetratricopeptide (TPR) repeat protein
VTELRTIHERLIKKNPNTYEAQRLSGYLALTENKLKDAINAFQQASRLKPYEPDVILVLMQTLLSDNRADEAEKIGKDLLKQNPKVAAAYNSLYLLYLRQQRRDDAERILHEKIKNLPNDVDARLQLASHYFGLRERDRGMAALRAITDDPKRFPEGYQTAGDFLYRVRDYDAAVQFYREGASRTTKDKLTYQKRLIEVLFTQGKTKEARELLIEARKANPKDDETLAMDAALRLGSANKDEVQKATADLQAIVTRLPGHATIRYNYGRAMALKGDYQQARIQFEEAIKLKPFYLLPRLGLAEILLRSNEYGRVLQLTQEVFKYDPGNVPARLMRTNALIRAGDTKQARLELTALAKAFPQLPEVNYQMGILETISGDFKAAEAIFRDLYNKTKDPKALAGLGESYLRQNRGDDALRLFQERLAQDPANIDNYLSVASIAARMQRHDLAIETFSEALKRNDRLPDVWVRIGEMYHAKGDQDNAIKSFNKAKEIDPKMVPAWLGLAVVAERQGDRKQSRAMYEQVLRLQADNPIALNNLAYQLAESGTDLDQALSMAQKARQKLPMNPDITDTLGWVYIKKNLHDSAIGLYRELIRTNPQRATYHYHLGLALAQKGNKPEAKKALEAALKNNPPREEETKIRELMSRIS